MFYKSQIKVKYTIGQMYLLQLVYEKIYLITYTFSPVVLSFPHIFDVH